MTDTVLVAVITAAATILCQLIISARSSSVIAYRVELLEKKVDELGAVVLKLCSDSGRKSSARSSEGVIPHLPHFALFSPDSPVT